MVFKQTFIQLYQKQGFQKLLNEVHYLLIMVFSSSLTVLNFEVSCVSNTTSIFV